jgi:hypothetical protein
MLLLFVGGASAVTLVINDGNAALSLAATPDQEVAFSFIAAKDPSSFSAAMTADDSSGAAAMQESNVEDADLVYSVSAGISPDGDSAYTYAVTWEGRVQTSQESRASQGNSAYARQQITSGAIAGISVVNATDSHGNTASETAAFLLGTLIDDLSAGTPGTRTTASQNGTMNAALGTTKGGAKSGDEQSWTDTGMAAGTMTFDSNAYAGVSTSADQEVSILGIIGSASAGSADGANFAGVRAGFAGSSLQTSGALSMDQEARTTGSAEVDQSGTVLTLNTTLGGAWTRTEAGNSSGRFVSVETQGRLTQITVSSSAAVSNDAFSLAFENKTRSLFSPTSTTTAYATNGIGTSMDTYSGIQRGTRGGAGVLSDIPLAYIISY